MKILIYLSLILASFSAFSDDKVKSIHANGCGTEGIQGVLVPDSTIFTNCQFHSACNNHDICYSKCKHGEPLHGQATCDDEIAKEQRRASCDTQFFSDILVDNENKWTCKIYANLYKFAVVKFGKGNFNGREIENLAQQATLGSQEEAENIYKNFVTDYNEAKPRTYNLTFDKTNSIILLKQEDINLNLDIDKLKKNVELRNSSIR